MSPCPDERGAGWGGTTDGSLYVFLTRLRQRCLLFPQVSGKCAVSITACLVSPLQRRCFCIEARGWGASSVALWVQASAARGEGGERLWPSDTHMGYMCSFKDKAGRAWLLEACYHWQESRRRLPGTGSWLVSKMTAEWWFAEWLTCYQTSMIHVMHGCFLFFHSFSVNLQ